MKPRTIICYTDGCLSALVRENNFQPQLLDERYLSSVGQQGSIEELSNSRFNEKLLWWIPGHNDTTGNEQDILAKLGGEDSIIETKPFFGINANTIKEIQ